MKEVVVCNFRQLGQQVFALVTSIARGSEGTAVAVRTGQGDCLDVAIGSAMSRPGLRFATARDELDAEIAAFRGRQLKVLARDNQLCSLGLV